MSSWWKHWLSRIKNLGIILDNRSNKIKFRRTFLFTIQQNKTNFFPMDRNIEILFLGILWTPKSFVDPSRNILPENIFHIVVFRYFDYYDHQSLFYNFLVCKLIYFVSAILKLIDKTFILIFKRHAISCVCVSIRPSVHL